MAFVLVAAAGCGQYADDASSGHGGSGGSASGHAGRGGGGTGGVAGDSVSSGGSLGEGGAATSGGEGGESEEGGKSGEGGACQSGFALCAGRAECTDLSVGDPQSKGVTNCGECGTTCHLDHASSTTCEAGACSPTCQAGFADCNSSAGNDGCETVTTVEDCGACQHACSQSGATSRECASGVCAPTCAPHYADCNQGAPLAQDDGCEVYLDSLDECTTSCTSAQSACAASQVCNDGSCVAPSGLAILSVPLTAKGQVQRFADLFAGMPNLEGITLTVRAYAPGAKGGTLVVYASDAESIFAATKVELELSSISTSWRDLSIHVESGGKFNATRVKQVNLEVHGAVGPWLNPTVVYVDSVRTSTLAVNDSFDSSFGNFVMSSLVAVPGSTVAWANALP
jgi:hypothetical protein